MIFSSVSDTGLSFRAPGVWISLFTAVCVLAVTFSVAVSSVAMAVGFALVGWKVLKGGRSAVPVSGLELAFGLFIVAEILASVFSVDPADSFYNMRRVLLIGVVYLVLSSVRSENQVRAFLLVLGCTAAATSMVEALSITRVDGVLERPTMFQMPLTEGGIRMMILLVLVPPVISASTPVRWRWAFAVPLIPLFAGLVATQTRSAWLAFICGAAVIGLLMDRRLLAALAVLVVLFLLFAPVDYRQRAYSIVDLTDESNWSRVQMLTTGWRMFLDRPLFGWGDTGLRNYYVTYVTPLTEGEGGHLHNNFMTALVTLGVFGFAAVCYLFYALLRVFLRTVRRSTAGEFRRVLGVGLLAAYAGFHVLGLFEFNFGDHEVMVLMWSLAGLAVWAGEAGSTAGPREVPA